MPHCLARVDQQKIPTLDKEKEELFLAGLGEKEIFFNNIDIDSNEFREIILEHFPRLKDGGGFRFLKGWLI